MKKKLSVMILLLGVLPLAGFGQKILMKINAVTAKDGEEVRAAEFKTDAATTWSSGAGASVGKPKTGPFIIKKTHNTSSNDLYKHILIGSEYPEVIFEYYDAAGKLYFTITLRNVFVSEFYWLTPECPGCLKLEHQVGFVPRKIETADLLTGITLKYDVSLAVTY
jgi:type VI protein secretion system component Hcp